MANIFGDSSDDSDDEPLEKTITITTTTGEELDKNDGDRKLDKNDEQDEDKEEDKEDEREDAEMKTSEKDEGVVVKKKKANNSVLDEYAGEDKEEATEGEKEERKGEPMHLIAALNEEEEDKDKDEEEDSTKEIYLNPIVSKATNIFERNRCGCSCRDASISVTE